MAPPPHPGHPGPADPAVRLLRARANLLHRPAGPGGPAGVADVVRALGGVQAQSWRAAGLAVRARRRGIRQRDVDAARVEERSVVRGWFMRGTLQLVPAEDVGWLLQALGPDLIAGSARRLGQLGLDDEAADAGAAAVTRAVTTHGPQTRAQLAERLACGRLRVDPRGQAPYHLIRRAALAGRICYGPDVDGSETWVPLEDWIGQPLHRLAGTDSAVVELARRYLAAYAPAEPEDFAAWSGLRLSRARAAFTAAGPAPRRRTPGREPGHVRLLPEFDPYLLGYRSREFAVPARYARRVHPGGGTFRPAVSVDGRVVGTWRLAKDGAVEVEPFGSERPPPSALDAEARDIARFLG